MTATNGDFLLRGICRTPIFPESTSNDLTAERLRELASNELVLQSILLASPSFYQDVLKWINGQLTDKKKLDRIEQILYKYLVRMSTRCTPFGLLSTSSFIELQATPAPFPATIPNKIHTKSRLDTCALQLLITQLENDPDLLPFIRFSINTSLYNLGEQLRYFESNLSDNKLTFELSKVSWNEALERILEVCRTASMTITQIVETCAFEEFSAEDVGAFIYELVQADILISEMAINICEPAPVVSLLATLERIEHEAKEHDFSAHQIINTVKEIHQLLSNDTELVNTKFNRLKALLKEAEVEAKPSDLMHVDAYKDLGTTAVSLKQELIDQLHDSRNILLKLAMPIQDRFTEFKKDFGRRYNERAMPLMQVLDPEIGIGYTQRGEQGDSSFLLKDVAFGTKNSAQQEISLSQVELFLLQKLQHANANNKQEISIAPKEIAGLPDINAPITQSAIVSILEDGNKLILEEFSGTSALNFLSRFSYLDERIAALSRDIHAVEDKATDAIIAEIQHLPEIKSGNIILAESPRQHAIPIVVNTSTGSPSQETILLNDILVKVDMHGKILLLSKTTGQRIVPRLSNTLNYTRDGIDIFRFLADLQLQEETPVLQFDWYRLKMLFKRFPRVTYRDVVLAPAFWIVNKTELAANATFEAVTSWREKNQIPTKVYLCSDDRDDFRLLIDFSNSIATEVFLQEIGKSDRVFLVEAIHLNTHYFKSENGQESYLNEIVLPFVKNVPSKEKKQAQEDNDADVEVQRAYPPGSEWLYFKVYTGHFTVNELVANNFYLLAQELLEKGVVQKWFFIRYFDSDYHLRIRFQSTSLEHNQYITQSVTNLLAPFIQQNIVHDVSANTYVRELDRYSNSTIAASEEIFFHDSMAVCNYLNLDVAYDQEWIFAAAGVDGILNDFRCSDAEKERMMGFVGNAFFREFSITKKEKLILDKKYRVCRNVLLQELNGMSDKESEFSATIHSILAVRSEHTQKAVQTILDTHAQDKAMDIMLSHIHMFLNRLFRANPRRQEMVLYYTLFKHYQSALAINAKGG